MLAELHQDTQSFLFFFFSPFCFFVVCGGTKVGNWRQCDRAIAASTTTGLDTMIAGVEASKVWVELGRVEFGFAK